MNGFARYDGTNWYAIGTGLTNTINIGLDVINAITPFRGRLYATGSFNLANSIPMNGIAEYNCVQDGFPVTVTGNLNFCSGGSVTLDAGIGFSSYLWSNGATTQSITVNSSGTFSVIVNTPCGNDTSASAVVNVNPLPAANAGTDDTICTNGTTLLNASGGISYLWSPSASLSNASVNNPVASPTVTTTYTVIVTDANGCSEQDSVRIVVDVCSGLPVLSSEISLSDFPNPSTGKFEMNASIKSGKLSVFNTIGECIFTFELMEGKNNFDFEQFPKGIYFVKVVDETGNSGTTKLMIE